jgi:hypothetical protein
MAPESKMDAEICFQHSVYRNSSFSKRFFCSFLFCFYFARIQNGGLHVIYLLKNHISKIIIISFVVHECQRNINLFCLQLQPFDLYPRLQTLFVSSKIALGAA